MEKKSFTPDGYNTVIPALAIKSAAIAIEWYKEIFNAKEKMVLRDHLGTVVHAELVIGDSMIMLAEENSQYNKSPKTLGGNSVNLCMYTADVDEVIKKAVGKGSHLIMPPADQFYGDRSGRIEDPFGYIWIISTHIRDVSAEEMQHLMDEMMSAAQ
jgi:PhnB protein